MSDDTPVTPLFPSNDPEPDADEGTDIAGFITPALNPDDPPLFTVVDRNEYPQPIEVCSHGNFVLDPKWQTVKCGKCENEVTAFAALLCYAEWYKQIMAQRRSAEWERIGVLRERLRAIQEKVALSDSDRKEIYRAFHFTGRDTTVANLSTLLQSMESKVKAAAMKKRAARKAKQQPDIRFGGRR